MTEELSEKNAQELEEITFLFVAFDEKVPSLLKIYVGN